MKILNEKFDYQLSTKLNHDEKYQNWPVVYLLENGKELYIGESTNVSRRMKQHLDNQERQKLDHVHIIEDDQFNKSATLDIESLLIEYMSADSKGFKLQNGNSGQKNHNYYDKAYYRKLFADIWDELKTLDLTQDRLIDIENNNLFKYSPYKTLTEDQLDIAKSIDKRIQANTSSLSVIKGEPGSGKTILAVYLALYFATHPQNAFKEIRVVVPMTSLRSSLKKVFSRISHLKKSMVIGPSGVIRDKGTYNLVIVDEAHRLAQRKNLSNYASFDQNNAKLGLDKENGTQLDWIMQSADHVILFYDEHQSVKPSDVSKEDFQKLNATWYSLKSQMRLNAGDYYSPYIEKLFNQTLTDYYHFEGYDFKLFTNVEKMYGVIREKDTQLGLSRMVAGYAWKWETKKGNKKKTRDYDIDIDGYHYIWNSTNDNWVNSDNAINEIGCIHTVQGYDLNYTGVIIGPELIYEDGQIKFVIENYKDVSGKDLSKAYDDMKAYILNIYKTLMTRGIRGTYIYCCDKGLENYMRQYIECEH